MLPLISCPKHKLVLVANISQTKHVPRTRKLLHLYSKIGMTVLQVISFPERRLVLVANIYQHKACTKNEKDIT